MTICQNELQESRELNERLSSNLMKLYAVLRSPKLVDLF